MAKRKAANVFLGRLGPADLCAAAEDWRKKAKDKWPKALSDDEPLGLKAYMAGSGFAGGGAAADGDTAELGINLVYDSFQAWLAKVGGRLPRPASIARAPSESRFADACNKLAEYRDVEMGGHQQIRKCLTDLFFRGIAYMRVSRDRRRGVSSSSRFSPRNVFWDHTASSVDGAKFVIERHTLPRYQFAKRFGNAAAAKADAVERQGQSLDVPGGEALKVGGKSLLDVIEYFLVWSKFDEENRFYALCPNGEVKNQFLNQDTDGPGERFGALIGRPDQDWPFGASEWHLCPLVATEIPDRIEGLDWTGPVHGEMQATQRLHAASVLANESASRTVVAVADTVKPLFEEALNDPARLSVVGLPDATMEAWKNSPRAAALELPRPPPELDKALANAQGAYDRISGHNAVAAIAPSNIETAAESQRLAGVADGRVAAQVAAIEQWYVDVERRELDVDCCTVPRHATVKIDGERVVKNVPYAQAVLLETGVDPEVRDRIEQEERDFAVQAAAEAVAGATVERGPKPAAEPEVAVRRAFGPNGRESVPLDADVEIVEPGIAAFVGPELADAWKEGMSPRAVRDLLLVRIERGSTNAADRTQAFNNLVVTGKTIGPFWDQAGRTGAELKERFHNEVVRALQSPGAEALLMPEGSFVREFDAAQQAAQAAAQQQSGQQPPPLDPNEQIRLQRDQVGLEKAHVQAQSGERKEEMRQARERTMQAPGAMAPVAA